MDVFLEKMFGLKVRPVWKANNDKNEAKKKKRKKEILFYAASSIKLDSCLLLKVRYSIKCMLKFLQKMFAQKC